MRDTTEMAREAGGRAQQNKNCDVEYVMSADALKAFEALVRADERDRTWTQEHWTEYERSIAAAEREACAQAVEAIEGCAQYFPHVPDAIRARGNT
jgi:hypothetical protein